METQTTTRLGRASRAAETAAKVLILRTDDPQYLPASGQQVDRLQKQFDELAYRSESVLQRSPIQEPISGLEELGGRTGRDADRLEQRFLDLVEKWKRETEFASSMLEFCMHPTYQRIIGMGPSAVPLILRELSSSPDHWFWALKAMTGEDPVPEEDRGDLAKMTRAWLRWASENGYHY